MAMSVGHSEYVHHVLPFSVFFQNVCMPISLQLFFSLLLSLLVRGFKNLFGFFFISHFAFSSDFPFAVQEVLIPEMCIWFVLSNTNKFLYQ